MNEFAAELEQVFGAAPSRETGLVVDMFDGAGLDGGGGVAFCVTNGTRPSVSPCRACPNTRVAACGGTRAVVPA
ncbi:hypothetical protein [Lentzea sp. NPDC051838]|uniref:hypothetical protein n=1 Tax=Lentzea sp. NPDC051838 TaxID=3154849 RepID=UPI00342F3287